MYHKHMIVFSFRNFRNICGELQEPPWSIDHNISIKRGFKLIGGKTKIFIQMLGNEDEFVDMLRRAVFDAFTRRLLERNHILIHAVYLISWIYQEKR